MTQIDKLTKATAFTTGMYLPVYDPTNLQPRRVDGTQLLTTLAGAIAPFGLSVKAFGAKGDGATDDTAAMQAAHNSGRLIYYPAGIYIFSKITIAKGGIIGDGINQSILVSTDTSTSDAIRFLGSDLPLFRDFSIQCPPSKTAGGAALHIDATTEIDHVVVDNIYVVNCYIGIQVTNATDAIISNSRVFNAVLAALYLENPANPDAGDCMVSNCTLEVLGASARVVLHRSGAWRFFNCKMLGGLISYSLEFSGITNSSDIFMIGCSLEGASQAAIGLARSSGTSNVGSVQIVGCEIGAPTGISTDTSGVVTLLVIEGNNITTSGTGSGNVAINLQNLAHFNIGPNVLNGAGGSSIAVQIDANCINGKVSAQTYNGYADANCLVNLSTSVYWQRSTQQGNANLAAASTAHGSLFRSTVAVTFPTPYKIIPTVVCYPGDSAASQVGCYATNVTKTGFTLVGIASTTGAVMNNNVWVAQGLI